MDDLALVRCSYCHDVHDTGGAPNTGTGPFLRGTWRQNPYREDGAPRSGQTSYSTTATFGAVPRGDLINGVMLGGWQIDQNNGNPNSTYNYATDDTLCGQCHTQAAIEAAAPLHKNSVRGFTNDTSANRNILRVGTHNSGDTYPSRGGQGPSSFQQSEPTPNMGYWFSTSTACQSRMLGLRETDDNGRGISPAIYARNNCEGKNDWRYGYTKFMWGVTQDLNTVQADFHSFSCSKCHNPHASRLPRLMITNCLDVKNNTWDDNLKPSGATNGQWTNSTNSNPANIDQLAYVSSAQNCHRRTENPVGNVIEKGWNNVTPW
ncbi:MAG: hypothetical protein D6751_11590 [Deltaproteobacteria bacterium]|nr:MAG: hypothetical protein D6751_11590 [Deltaproteobacteria bacterium]